MTNKTISTTTLKNRRQEIKKQRRCRDLLSVLRTLMIMSFVGGTFWFLTLPDWVIRDGQQVKIEGNELLAEDEIRGLIELDYPQSLLKLSTQDLKAKLEHKIPVSDIQIAKKIFPPKLMIQVKEKKPVAIAIEPQRIEKSKKITYQKIGYIDRDGVFVAGDLYQNLQKNPEQMPSLKIIGSPRMYLVYWADLYNLITQSEVKITEVDWRNPSNLIFTTELGKVHIGGYTSKLPEQLTTLAQMRSLPQKIPLNKIAYLDLSDPEIPSVKEKK